MKIANVGNSEFGGVASDSNNYEGRIDRTEIPHERAEAKRAVDGGRTNDFSVGNWKVGADCAN